MSSSLFTQEDSEPSLPSHLPAPPSPPRPLPGPGAFSGGSFSGGSISGAGAGSPGREPGGGGAAGLGFSGGAANGLSFFAGVPPVPPPQNTPDEGPPADGEEGEEGEEGPPEEPPEVPFGLHHIILILVPQFKARIANLPKYMGANVKVSLPVTVFFDKLKLSDPPSEFVHPSPFYGPYFPNGHYVKKRNVPEAVERSNRGSKNKTPKRPSFNESIYGAERVMLIPRLEKLLGSFGLQGKPCLLRAICEVHEVPLQHHGYGLFGEVLTLLLSISRSAFAGSHLSEYLTAEEFGRHGNCSSYFKTCSSSLFYWEKNHGGINQTELEEDEFELFREFSHFL